MRSFVSVDMAANAAYGGQNLCLVLPNGKVSVTIRL